MNCIIKEISNFLCLIVATVDCATIEIINSYGVLSDIPARPESGATNHGRLYRDVHVLTKTSRRATVHIFTLYDL